MELFEKGNALEVAWNARLNHVLAEKRHRIRICNLIVAVRVNSLQKIVDFALRCDQVEVGHLYVLLKKICWTVLANFIHNVNKLLELFVVEVA